MVSFESKFERAPQPSFVPPAVESFFDEKLAQTTWPEVVTSNPAFQEQIKKQRLLLDSFHQTIKNVSPGTNIDVALEKDLVKIEELEVFYERLAEYLEDNPEYARMVLYFPFELLPSPRTASHYPELASYVNTFIATYKSAWQTQLGFHEVRANFVDGDVLEQELLTGDHPRVVKATHLIPGLVERGVMTAAEVCNYAETSDDQLLKDGILDACEVLLDKSLVTLEDLALLKDSSDPYLRSGFNFLAAHTISSDEKKDGAPQDIPTLLSNFEEKLTGISSEVEVSTSARMDWLRKNAREKDTALYAKKVAVALESGDMLPSTDVLTPDTALVAISALRQAALHQSDIYQKHHTWLEAVKSKLVTDEIADALTQFYAHLNVAGLVSNEEREMQGEHMPALAGPFSENLKQIEPFLRDVKAMTSVIEHDPYLSTRVYPVTLVFGSQLKGYGTKNADADVAVFVRPGVGQGERAQIETHLSGVFNHEKIGGKAVLFWLDEIDTGLAVHDWHDDTNSAGQSSWVHVLFGAAWEGDKKCIDELHHKLLTNYFYDPGTQLGGKSTRERWLEEMERDTLQYRLLHKGFERFFPIISSMDTAHGDAIDGKSAFWDPQYRRMATELYLHRIFLPKLER